MLRLAALLLVVVGMAATAAGGYAVGYHRAAGREHVPTAVEMRRAVERAVRDEADRERNARDLGCEWDC